MWIRSVMIVLWASFCLAGEIFAQENTVAELCPEDFESTEAYLTAVDERAKANYAENLRREEWMQAEREKTERGMFAYHPEEDLKFSTQFGGRLHFYAAGFSDDASGMSDGFELQRARLYLHTNFAHFLLNTFFWASVLDEDANQMANEQKDSPWGNFGFGKLELDFAGPKIVPKDIYLK